MRPDQYVKKFMNSTMLLYMEKSLELNEKEINYLTLKHCCPLFAMRNQLKHNDSVGQHLMKYKGFFTDPSIVDEVSCDYTRGLVQQCVDYAK